MTISPRNQWPKILNLALSAIVLNLNFSLNLNSALLMMPAQSQPNHDNAISVQETAQTFQRLAPTLRYFDINQVLYDRFQPYGKPSYNGLPTEEKSVFAEINSPHHSTANLLPLLKDKDAKVRTLALAALYAKEDAKLLPQFASMVDDHEKTYSEPLRIALRSPANALPPMQEKTVGQIAEAIVRFYMEAAGYHYGVKGSGQEPGFSQYWHQRKDRNYCASWFAIKLRRASTGTSPTDKTRADKIASVRAQIDKISGADRDWILLWLQTENGFDLLASEADINRALKRLGADNLAKMLQRKIPTTDPDLKMRKSNDFSYKSLMLCVLKRAASHLRRDQVDMLLACDRWERAYQEHQISDPLIGPNFAIAAAQLDPSRANELLKNEFARLDKDFYGYQKAELAAALWQSAGLKETAFLLNCFYDSSSFYKTGQYSHFRPEWLKAIGRSEHDRKHLLKTLIYDPRFTKFADCSGLQALIEVTSKLNGKPTADAAHTDHAWHPLGIDNCCINLQAASKQYPKETQDLLDVMTKWRRELQVSVASWP